jgi:cytochrome P450
MAWTLLAIAGHPEVEERVVAELDTLGLLAKPGCPEPRELEIADLSNLPYLAAVIKESMRLFSVRVRSRQQFLCCVAPF